MSDRPSARRSGLEVDVPIGECRVIRLSLYTLVAGHVTAEQRVLFGYSWSDSPGRATDGPSFSIPASAVPQLRGALVRLERELEEVDQPCHDNKVKGGSDAKE